IGASQFTVQVSGKTIFLPDPHILPVRNVPVVHVGSDLSVDGEADQLSKLMASKIDSADLAPNARMAIAFGWKGEPDYARIRLVGEALCSAIGQRRRPDDLCFLM